MEVVSEYDGWGRTIVRCGGTCGGEVATVYGTAAGFFLIGLGVGASQIIGEDDRDLIAGTCQRCGRPGTIDPVELRRAARAHRRTYVLQ